MRLICKERKMGKQDKLHTGEIYFYNDPELLQEQKERMKLLYEYNQTAPWEEEKRALLLRQMLAEAGEGCCIEPPFHANWAGKFIHFGKRVYANFNLTAVDDTHIYVGYRHPPRRSKASAKRRSVQSSDSYRRKLLDWSRIHHPSRCDHR